jgi:glutathionylspermidine synthase
MMVTLRHISPLPVDALEKLGFAWHTDNDNTPYIADELVVINEAQAQAYYDAANELYDMYIKAGEFVIEHNLLHDIGIPFNLVELVKESWENDVHWHLYGRFDLAGGIDDKPIKLLEFNADTPTALFETAIVQWALLKYNGMDETRQFNALYEALRDNFRRIVTLYDDPDRFDSLYEGWRFLFSSVQGNIEEEQTVRLLQHIAEDAGFNTAFAYADEVAFDAKDGIFVDDTNYELWFKLIAWEEIALEEPDLAMLLTQIVKNRKAIIFNPAYTLMFQSKGMLPILWELFPGHPLLLESSFQPLEGMKQVQKPFFGREGESIRILNEEGNIIKGEPGAYDNFKSVYQAYTELPQDEQGRYYQAGVFYAYEACGLGYRRGGAILNNTSKFVGHMIED